MSVGETALLIDRLDEKNKREKLRGNSNKEREKYKQTADPRIPKAHQEHTI